MKRLLFSALAASAFACLAGEYSVWPAKRPFAMTGAVVSARYATNVTVKVARTVGSEASYEYLTNGTVSVTRSVTRVTNDVLSASFASGVTQTNLPSAYFILDGDDVLVTGPAVLIGK